MVLSPRFAWYQTPGNGNATHRICLYWFPRKIACQPALSKHTVFSGVRERSLPLEVSTIRTEAALYEGAGANILCCAVYRGRDHLPFGAKRVHWGVRRCFRQANQGSPYHTRWRSLLPGSSRIHGRSGANVTAWIFRGWESLIQSAFGKSRRKYKVNTRRTWRVSLRT